MLEMMGRAQGSIRNWLRIEPREETREYFILEASQGWAVPTCWL